MRPKLKFEIILVFACLIIGEASAQVKTAFSPDYFPIDQKTYCLRSFEWTVGGTNHNRSVIIGKSTVPYKQGPLSGALICEIGQGASSLSTWHNDGVTLKALMDSDHFPSIDRNLTDHSGSFGLIQDGQRMLPGLPYYAVKKGLSFSYESYDFTNLLFRIQDVTVQGRLYRDSIIVWEFEAPDVPYVAPSEANMTKYAQLGITPPTLADAGGVGISRFIILAKGLGSIAQGRFRDGSLATVNELVSISCNDKAPVFDAFDVPGTRVTRAQGSNENGDIVGEYQWNTHAPSNSPDVPDADTRIHGFLKDKQGTFTTIDYPGAVNTSARDINDRGDIVGTYWVRVGQMLQPHGFIFSKGRFTSVDFPVVAPGIPNAGLTGINNRGDVVGTYWGPPGPAGTAQAGTMHAFVLRNDVFTRIDYPGADRTVALGANESGDIVGAYGNRNEGQLTPHGFLLSNGVFTSIDFPSEQATAPQGDSAQVTRTEARGINAAGDIVGAYWVNPGLSRGFLLSKGVFKSIEPPCSFQSVLSDITSQGDAIGEFVDSFYREVTQPPAGGKPNGAWYGFRVSGN